MSSEQRMLQMTVGDRISDDTFVHQTENRTIFYRKATSLWVENDGKKTKVELLGGFHYSMMVAQGNSIYYGSNWKRKIYRAEFKENNIQTYYLRDLLKGENIHPDGMCSIICDGKVYAYRMCDDPVRERNPIDVPVDTLEWLELKGMIGCSPALIGAHPVGYIPNVSSDLVPKTAIFRKITREAILPSVKRMGNHAIVLSCYRAQPRKFYESGDSRADMAEYNAPWGSQAIVKNGFVYMTNGESLFAIDGDTAEMLPPLHFLDVTSFHIAGIHGPALFGRGKSKKSGKYHVISAFLPYEYVFKNPSSIAPVIQIAQGFQSKFLNEFDVKKIRGKGGFGCVFEAVNKYDQWEYAVKRIHVATEDLGKALLEVRAMAKFDHPNIVRYNSTWVENPPEGWQREADAKMLNDMNETEKNLMNYNDCDQFIYIQMQLCNYSLFDWLAKNQDQSTRELHRMKLWFKQIVSAVDYIHKRNLIHRDLKPSNILFSETDHLKLCDLGIATERRCDEDSNTELPRTFWSGTLMYMSPEQWLVRRYSSKSDVFSLGLIFVELCTVMGTDQFEIFNTFRLGTAKDVIEDEKTAEFITWLTQVEPRLRPTCAEMLDHLYLA